jgi:phosphoglycolate phosphatase-like HAD superfamily hydrolase
MHSAVEADFVFFDCDGVILDSNAIKTQAFRFALEGHPEKKVDELVQFHLDHGGVSRFDKFRYFFEEIADSPGKPDYESALLRFQEYCQKNLAETNLVPGVLDYLEFLRQRKIPMYVVSGAAQDELRQILQHKEIDCYFEEILGSPTSKRTNLEYLMAKTPVGGSGLYFGDALLDYEIAVENKLEFTFVYGVSDWLQGRAFCADRGVRAIPDFRELNF